MKFTKGPTGENYRAADFAVADAKRKRKPRSGTAAHLARLFLEKLDAAGVVGVEWPVEALVAKTLANGHVRELCAHLEKLPETDWQVLAQTLAKGSVRELCAYLEERAK